MITMYPRPESFIGKEVDGHRIDAVLGRGGMGIVFKAENLELSRTVALKIINPALAQDESFLRRFRAEARALAQIHHPNIVIVYAFRQFDMGFYISMEYVEGITLADHLEEKGPLPWRETIYLTKQMLSAFHYAHSCGVIHRDIKPRNILLTPKNVVKITDFGLAKVLQEGKMTTDTTVTMTTGGTIHYMPPEQIRGLRNVDHRGDIFSLGMTMYESISGALPFDKNASGYTIQKMIVEEAFPDIRRRIPTIPKPLAKIIMKALEKEPHKRFQSAAEMISAIEEFEMNSAPTVSANGVPSTTSFAPSLYVERWKIYASLVGLLIVAGAFIGIFMPDRFSSLFAGESMTNRPSLAEQLSNTNENTGVNEAQATPIPLDPDPGTNTVDSTDSTTPDDTPDIDTLSNNPAPPPVTTPANDPITSTPVSASSEGTGSIRVDSNPRGADIVLNDEVVGKTPMLLDNIEAGPFNLELRLSNYETYTTQSEVRSFAITSITGQLTPIKGVISLTYTPGSELYIDGKIFDPESDGSFSIELIESSHDILLAHPDYGQWRRSVNVVGGDSVHLDIDFTQTVRLIVTAFDTDDNGMYAEIYLDGKPTGHYTPTPFEVPVGEHTISVRAEGHELAEEETLMTYDATTEGPLRFVLKKTDQ